MDDRICMGAVVGAHGVRGLVRVKSFAESDADMLAYGLLEDDAGKRYVLKLQGRAKGVLLVRIEGVADRASAEALKGTRLHVRRDALPPAEADEYYNADLIGLRVEHVDGSDIGSVVDVQDFGAGVLIDVRLAGSNKTMLLPFDRTTVPVVDLDAGRLLVDPMPGLLGDDPDDAPELGEAGPGEESGAAG